MDTTELVSLHRAGTLLDEAYPVLESELARRGVPIDPRPPPAPVVAEPPFFSGHWEGAYPLASARWFVGGLIPAFWILASYGVWAIAQYLWPDSPLVRVLQTALPLIFLGYLVFATVAVWRCAKNEVQTMGMGIRLLGAFLQIAVLATAGIWALIASLG